MGKATVTIHIKAFVYTYDFISLGLTPRRKVAGLYTIQFCVPSSDTQELSCTTSLSALGMLSWAFF